jgi:uncharacterized protein (TIGR03437 family)
MRLQRVDSAWVRLLCAAVLNRPMRRVSWLSGMSWAFGLMLVLLSVSGLVQHTGFVSFAARDISASAVATVSAASFEATPVAPESIVASFGLNLATRTALAAGDADPNTPGIQLPTELAGTTVEVNGRRAGLFFVSANQINYLIPDSAPDGTVTISVRSGDGTVSTGTVQIATVAPGIFSANGNGKGVAAALALRVKNPPPNIYETIAEYNSTVNRMVTKPIDLQTDPVYLILYVTGLRYVENPTSTVSVLIGGVQVAPIFAGPVQGLAGLDQVNVLIPSSLVGRGVVSVVITVLGYNSSNLVEIELAGNASGPTAPQIAGFNIPQPLVGYDNQAVAGRMLMISGSGFSTDKTANKVYIGPNATEAQVMTATETQLEVVVPFGVETGTIKVTTPLGEGVSTSVLPVVTSISGIVENTNRQPLGGVTIQLSDTQMTQTQTSNDGTFVLPAVEPGPLAIQVLGSQIPTQPPYPSITVKIVAASGRDTQFERAIALQQETGSSGTVGGGTGTPLTGNGFTQSGLQSGTQQQQPAPLPPLVMIQTGNFSLQVPSTANVEFPDGSTSGRLTLTPLQNGRVPVALPLGIYSSSIIQITPFDTKISPGMKVVFPNTDGFAAGSVLNLYRYDPTAGQFVQVEEAKVAVTADGKSIETGPYDIQTTSYYFATNSRPTTTVTGSVLCCVNETGSTATSRPEPVSGAIVKLRGQEQRTDGNGSYVLRNVPVTAGENVIVDVTYIRPDKRVDRVQSTEAPVVVGGVTKVAATYLPSSSVNREPIILAPAKAEVPSGETTDIGVVIYDPDDGQQISASISSGPSWASLVKLQGGGQILNANAWILRLSPPKEENVTLTLSVTDGRGGTAGHTISVAVTKSNRTPTANSLELTTDEDTPLAIKLSGSDPDGNLLTYKTASSPLNGGLTGVAPNLTYVPQANFNGSDIFFFTVNDGRLTSLPASVKITVKPVNDAPALTVNPAAITVSEGQPLVLNLNAADIDQGQTLTFSATGLPAGGTIAATSATSSQFHWTPNFTQAGSYTIIFKVTDNGTPALSDTKEVKVTVTDVPTFSVPGPQVVNEGQPLIFDLAIPNAQAGSSVTSANLPAGAALTATTLGVWQFKWTPSFTQSGVYAVTFRATNSNVTDSRDVSITVNDTQRELSTEPGDFVIFGANGPAPRNNLDAGEALGTSLATGDLNGDGVTDLVIGAPTANTGIQEAGQDTGAVYIFFGKTTLGGTLDLAQQKPDVTLFGERSFDAFGASVALGDISGDGQPDLIIGAPLADSTSLRECGKVYAVFGPFPPEGLEADQSAVINRLASLTITGLQTNDKFGTRVVTGLFRAKTGPADLLVSAPGTDVRSSTSVSTLIDGGTVYLLAGGPTLIGERDLTKAPANFMLNGDTTGAQLGLSLAVGNFNGDDYADFAVGAPLENGILAKAAGSTYMIFGASALAGTRWANPRSVAYYLTGAAEGDNFGASVALGDLNGDGFADLIVGSPGDDGPLTSQRPNTGEVIVVFGTSGFPGKMLFVYGAGRREDTTPDALGSAVATGDFNGDGIADLLMGAPGADVSTEKREPLGAAYLIFGSRTGLPTTYDLQTKAADLTIYGAFPGDRLGQGALGFGNVNGGEVTDLILGIPRSASVNNARPEAGEVRVLFGVRR